MGNAKLCLQGCRLWQTGDKRLFDLIPHSLRTSHTFLWPGEYSVKQMKT